MAGIKYATRLDDMMREPYGALKEHTAEVRWELWYQDVFDRACPRQIQHTGVGLLEGLAKLWAYHLGEAVQFDGQNGFSRFNLWWVQKGQSVIIEGDAQGQAALKNWVTGDANDLTPMDMKYHDQNLLKKIALAHALLVLDGQSCQEILDIAANAATRADFETQLTNLITASQG